MNNPYLKDFLSVIKQRYADENSRMPMSEWICKNTRHPKAKLTQTTPFSFKGYEFQIAIADDMHKDASVKKPSQVGLTEIQIRKFFGIMKRYAPLNGIFTLPDDNMYQRVSQGRAGPIVKAEPIFNQHPIDAKPIRSMDVYQIDNSFGYFTGNKESDATSINADFVMHDELDLSDQSKIALFQSRLQNSTFKMRQKFSTPSFPGYGIDGELLLSDQREYLCRCEKCNHHNVPEFTPQFIHLENAPDIGDFSELSDVQITSIDYEKSRIMCEHCHAPLNLVDPTLREWVPKRPGSPKRGYNVTPFCVSTRTPLDILTQLMEYRRNENMRGWHNTVLGKAYADAKARLTEAQIKAVITNDGYHPNKDTPCFIGIDVGLICHVVVGTPNVVFFWKKVKAEELLDLVIDLCTRYRIVKGAADRFPYTPTVNAIRDKTKGRVLPVEYRGTAPVKLVKGEMDEITHAQASRTFMLDAVQQAVANKTRTFANLEGERETVIAHLQDMVRKEEEPGKPAEWLKLTKQDHFFHALAFYFCALKLKDVQDFSSDKETRTMFGWGAPVPSKLELSPFDPKLRLKKDTLLWPAD